MGICSEVYLYNRKEKKVQEMKNKKGGGCIFNNHISAKQYMLLHKNKRW